MYVVTFRLCFFFLIIFYDVIILQHCQARLPEARVIYCSATGASEPRNMGYMVRLGLWGAGTCFPKFHDFLGLFPFTISIFFRDHLLYHFPSWLSLVDGACTCIYYPVISICIACLCQDCSKAVSFLIAYVH